MVFVTRIALPLALALAVGGCSLGSLLGGGGKTPESLLTLTPEAAPVGAFTRAANAGTAVTINTPVVADELRTVRVPVQVTPYDVAYVQDLQWVATPDRLFRDLLAETVRRRTSRVVLDPRQTALDPGLIVSGQLQRFGYDAATGQVLVRFDANLATAGGTRVETRRFEATAPADGTAATVGPALNRAANQVALDFAAWIAR
jgi:cholesterol transport system auxiliary component